MKLRSSRLENMLYTNIAVNNATTGVLATSTVVRSGTTPETITGKNWVPKNVVAPSHDFDGNLTNDGLWTYTWDAENRLVSMAMDGNAGYATRVKLDFLYDSQHRRVSKAVSTTTSQVVSPTWTLQSTTRFLYDGWNMIAQYSFASNVFTAQAQYVWGLDVNGSSAIASATAGAMQSAGGVGGLLHAKLIDAANALCLPCYDGNGNIMAWVDGANSALIERREYDSFGSMVSIYKLATNATLHGRLAYGFSTKWRDAESDLLYYGHRYYNPSTQRWPSRDPIEERGGVNLYGFVGNDGVNGIDMLGFFRTRIDARNAARDAIGAKTRESRLKGAQEIQNYLFYIINFKQNLSFRTSDAAIVTVAKSIGTHKVIAGVEYSTVVYCDNSANDDEKYGFLEPIRGTMPSSAEISKGSEGWSSSLDEIRPAVRAISPTALPLEHLHTHNISSGYLYNSRDLHRSAFGYITEEGKIYKGFEEFVVDLRLPIRSGPSTSDYVFKNSLGGAMRTFIVLEGVAEGVMQFYNTPFAPKFDLFEY